MSRVGKKPIIIPENVDVKIGDNKIVVKGPKGEDFQEIRPEIKVELKDGKIFVSPESEDKKIRAFWGLTRNLIANLLKGVTTGFEKKLEIEGIGFKAIIESDNLLLYVGFSNPVRLKIPPGLKISVEKNIIIVSGVNKELVGQTAALIRRVKPAEPYKGKGIKYAGETIRRKVGKKVVTTGRIISE